MSVRSIHSASIGHLVAQSEPPQWVHGRSSNPSESPDTTICPWPVGTANTIAESWTGLDAMWPPARAPSVGHSSGSARSHTLVRLKPAPLPNSSPSSSQVLAAPEVRGQCLPMHRTPLHQPSPKPLRTAAQLASVKPGALGASARSCGYT